MNLGIILASGDSFKNMKTSGQDSLFKNFYLREFARRFSKVYVFSYENEKVNGLPQNVIVVPNKLRINRFLYGLAMPFLNYRKVQDVNVFRAYHLFGTLPAIVSKVFFQKPYVFNYGYDYERIAKIENRLFQLFLLRVVKPVAISLATKIFVANKQILKKIQLKKTIYLPNGTNTNFFKPQKLKKQNKNINILAVGRLERQKNFENLISSLKGLKTKLTIVGQGSLKNNLLDRAKVCRVNLTLIPLVENKNMPKVYSQADIFVIPSLSEGSPKVLLEAMSCGLAVVASKVQGNSEIVNSTNGVFCQTSSASMKKAILYLAKNPNIRKKLAKNARNFIVNNFDLKLLFKKEVDALKLVSR